MATWHKLHSSSLRQNHQRLFSKCQIQTPRSRVYQNKMYREEVYSFSIFQDMQKYQIVKSVREIPDGMYFYTSSRSKKFIDLVENIYKDRPRRHHIKAS